MGFKYTAVTDTMPWIGYNMLETPREIMAALAEAGYDGVDVPGRSHPDGRQRVAKNGGGGRFRSAGSARGLGVLPRRRGTESCQCRCGRSSPGGAVREGYR